MLPTGSHTVEGIRLSSDEVLERVAWLQQSQQSQQTTRTKIRQILNGGTEGIRALLGNAVAEIDDMIPVPPLMQSGLRRLAQKIGGAIPDLRVDAHGYANSETARRAAEKRERIVHSYDRTSRLGLQLPQVGRWLPGYGFIMWIVKDQRNGRGERYPHAQLRDPYTVFPGAWNADQQPIEAATLQQVAYADLVRMWPEQRPVIDAEILKRRPKTKGGGVLLDSSGRSWANQTGAGYQVAEYWYDQGTWVVCLDLQVPLDFIPNPLYPEQRFVLAKRFSFDQLNGHYDHLVGLMSIMARIEILEYINLEDSVFSPTNIFGQPMEGDVYRTGRNAVNRFEAGTGARVERPTSNLPYQLFQGIDRMERQLRYGASYPITDDAQSPSSWTTGQGLSALRADVDLEIKEYRTIVGTALEDLDARRLAWDQIRNGGQRRTVEGFFRDAAYSEAYDPAEINGRWNTRRVYGVMAGWDESSKIVGGLQLLQAEAIDMQTFQENLDGLEGITKVNERVRGSKAEQAAWQMLQQAAMQPNPAAPDEMIRARLAITDIIRQPERFIETLTRFYSEKPPQPTEPQQEMLGQTQPGMQMPADGDIQTILSRLEAGGQMMAGAQTVGRI